MTLLDDAAVDIITGGADNDWFLRDLVDDSLTDAGGGDIIDLL